jgi:hypothetical protein
VTVSGVLVVAGRGSMSFSSDRLGPGNFRVLRYHISSGPHFFRFAALENERVLWRGGSIEREANVLQIRSQPS